MDSADELLLLAHGIVTFDSVVSDLEDLDALQVSTPYRVEETARKHRTAFAQLWWQKVHADPVWKDEYLPTVVEEAREWAASGRTRLAELREGKVRE